MPNTSMTRPMRTGIGILTSIVDVRRLVRLYILPSLAPTHSRLDLHHWDEFEFRGASGLRFRFLRCISWSLVLQDGSPSCAHEEIWRRRKNEVVVGVEGASGRDATGMRTM